MRRTNGDYREPQEPLSGLPASFPHKILPFFFFLVFPVTAVEPSMHKENRAFWEEDDGEVL